MAVSGGGTADQECKKDLSRGHSHKRWLTGSDRSQVEFCDAAQAPGVVDGFVGEHVAHYGRLRGLWPQDNDGIAGQDRMKGGSDG